MRLLVSILLLSVLAANAQERRRAVTVPLRASGGGSSITADFWQTFEFATVNGSNLDSNDGTSTGTWSVTDASGLLSTSTTGQQSFSSLINGLSDSGTRGLARSYSSTATATPTFDIGSGNTKANVSHSFWFRIEGNPTVNKRLSLLYGTSVECLRVDYQYSTDTVTFNGGANSNGVALSQSTFYRCEVQFNQNATCYGRVYSTVGAQVGNEFTVTGANQAWRYWQIYGGNELADAGITFYWDNVLFDWTDATYPLGP